MENYWSKVSAQRWSRRRALVAGIGGVSGLALLAACGSDSSEDDGGDQRPPVDTSVYTYKPEGARKGGKLSMQTPAVANWNPVAVFSNGTILAGAHVFDRLLSSELGGARYTLEAAESIETSDPLKVVFKLKPGMVFQDRAPVSGRAVAAADIVATQEYITKLPNAYDRSFQVNFLERIEAPDNNTVIMHLKKPDAYLFGSNHLGNSTAQPIIPAEMLEKPESTPWIGSGPYELREDQSQLTQRFVYRRFEKFRNAANVYIDEREYLVLTDLAAIEAALRSDQLQVGVNTYPTADRIAAEDSRFTLSEVGGVQFAAMHLNMATDLPWKKDQRVREALYRLTNRAQIVSFATKDKADIMHGTLPVAVVDYLLEEKDTAQYYKTDVQEAKRLLDAASFDYSREWELIPFGGVAGSIQEQTVIVWEQQAAAVGFKTRINSSLPTSQLLSEVIAKANFQLFFALAPGGNDPAYALRLYHSDSLSQYTHFGLHDPAIDALIEKAEGLVNYDENIKLVKDLQIQLLKKYASPIAFFTPKWRTLYNSKIQNYDIRPIPIPRYNTGAWIKQA